jgi:hypothetical protein
MERFEAKTQLIDASSTQPDPSEHRERRIAAKVNSEHRGEPTRVKVMELAPSLTVSVSG